jgi:hypothetical protein
LQVRRMVINQAGEAEFGGEGARMTLVRFAPR